MIRLILNFLERTVFGKYPSFWQFVKYSFVGVLNTLTDFVVYYAITRLIAWFAHYYLIANAVSFSFAVTQSFFLNKFWTFQNLEKKKMYFQYLKFFIVNLFTLAVNQLIFYSLVDLLNTYDLYAKVILIFSSVLINFSLVKLWVFKK